MTSNEESGRLIRGVDVARRRYHIVTVILGVIAILGGLLLSISVYLCMWFDIRSPLFSWAGSWDAFVMFVFNFGLVVPWFGAAVAWAGALGLELERSRKWSSGYAQLVRTFVAFVALPPLLTVSARLLADAMLL